MAAKLGGVVTTTCASCRLILTRKTSIPGFNLNLTRHNSSHHYGSLVSTSLPDVDSEIENVSPHSARGKAMRALKQRLQRTRPMPPPRELRMKDDQDWTAVYPTAATFKWSSVPLPVRMGLPVKSGLPPHKYGNTELMKLIYLDNVQDNPRKPLQEAYFHRGPFTRMKLGQPGIPNFLHLTPPAIKKHCAALKELCTEWPAGLETDEKCEKHFPMEVVSSDYLFSAPSLRHPGARVATIKVKLSNLQLDKHARWKLLQLIGDRYDEETDLITITTDRCPVRKQNYDYAMYLLTVLFHESWVTEPWEASITEDDMEEFVWDINQSRKNLLKVIARMENKENVSGELSTEEESEVLSRPEVVKFKEVVTKLRNEEESVELLHRYKEAALNIVHRKVEPLQA